MRAQWTTVFVLLSLAAIVVPASAHHSLSKEFDPNRRVTLTGVVTKLDWTNPHVWIYMNVQVSGRSDVEWGIESAPPNALKRKGITAAVLPIGTRVRIEGFAAIDPNARRVSGISVTLPDGTQLGIEDSWSWTPVR